MCLLINPRARAPARGATRPARPHISRNTNRRYSRLPAGQRDGSGNDDRAFQMAGKGASNDPP